MSLDRDLAAIRSELGEFQPADNNDGAAVDDLKVPPIVQFAAEWLGVAMRPAVATLLKVMALEVESFTDFDREVLATWMGGFTAREGLDGGWQYEGTEGTTPDVLERIARCIDEGHFIFPEIVLPLGRRAGKGLVGAIALASFSTKHLEHGDPRIHMGLPGHKPLVIQVFASDADQSADTIFRELGGLLDGCTQLAPYLAPVPATTHRITLASPTDGKPWIEIRAESTRAGGARGVDAIAVVGDEFAHVGSPTTTTDADILTAAEPALLSAGAARLLLLTSTPAGPRGVFHERYMAAARAQVTKSFMLQLPSWGLDVGMDRAAELEMWPGGPMFPAATRPPISRDELEEKRLNDPRGYAQEYLAQFILIKDALFTSDHIETMFDPDRWASITSQGLTGATFVHVDPAFRHDRFAYVVGQQIELNGMPGLAIIEARAFSPNEHGGVLDYDSMVEELVGVISDRRPRLITMDQHEQNGLIAALKRRKEIAHILPDFVPRPATSKLNQCMIQAALSSARQRQIAINPRLHELRIETTALQRVGNTPQAPTTGACTTDDMAISLLNVNHLVLDPSEGIFQQFRDFAASASYTDREVARQFSEFNSGIPTASTNPARSGHRAETQRRTPVLPVVGRSIHRSG